MEGEVTVFPLINLTWITCQWKIRAQNQSNQIIVEEIKIASGKHMFIKKYYQVLLAHLQGVQEIL